MRVLLVLRLDHGPDYTIYFRLIYNVHVAVIFAIVVLFGYLISLETDISKVYSAMRFSRLMVVMRFLGQNFIILIPISIYLTTIFQQSQFSAIFPEFLKIDEEFWLQYKLNYVRAKYVSWVLLGTLAFRGVSILVIYVISWYNMFFGPEIPLYKYFLLECFDLIMLSIQVQYILAVYLVWQRYGFVNQKLMELADHDGYNLGVLKFCWSTQQKWMIDGKLEYKLQ